MIAEARLQAGGPLFCFAGGGTGGHLYPALAVADAIRALVPDARFLFFRTGRRVDNHILDRSGYESAPQALAPVTYRPWRWPRMLGSLRVALRDCRGRFLQDRPVCVIGTGGLASIPAVLQGVRMGIPTGILNPDALPGRANRYLARKVDAVFAQWEVTGTHLSRGNVVVTGCPVRPEFHSVDRAAGVVRFGLDSKRRTLLITGASQGARSINDAILRLAAFLSGVGGWQILHLAGDQDFERVRATYSANAVSAIVISYTDHMAEALAAADLIVSRAGASTLAELTALGRASILLPYPYHKDQHQLANAECLARRGAAVVVRDRVEADANAPALLRELKRLMLDDGARGTMAGAAAAMGRPLAAGDIAEAVLRMSQTQHRFAGFERVKRALAGTR